MPEKKKNIIVTASILINILRLTQYSKRARQTPFVYYIESFTISRQSISIKSHEESWVLFTISRILLYQGILYQVSGVLPNN